MVLLLLGCNLPPPPFNQLKAHSSIHLVWNFYQEQHRPPQITWVHGSQLNCGEGNQGFFREQTPLERRFSIPLTCVIGVFWENSYKAYVAIPLGNDFRPSESALAHELYHAHLYKTLGSADPNHEDSGFAVGGAVQQAEELLKSSGY